MFAAFTTILEPCFLNLKIYIVESLTEVIVKLKLPISHRNIVKKVSLKYVKHVFSEFIKKIPVFEKYSGLVIKRIIRALSVTKVQMRRVTYNPPCIYLFKVNDGNT